MSLISVDPVQCFICLTNDVSLNREFDDTIDALQGDIEALEGEKVELKEKIKLMSKKSMLEGFARGGAGQSGTFVTFATVFSPYTIHLHFSVLHCDYRVLRLFYLFINTIYFVLLSACISLNE